MPRLALALAAALVLGAAGCSTSPCQTLGEKLCACTGVAHDACTTQVENELKAVEVDDGRCDAILNSCNDNKPADVEFCDWMLTEKGKTSCGLAPQPLQ